MSVAFHIVIPARMAATRLPGKPLLDVAGKPLILRCLDSALATGAQSVLVATDDERIAEAVRAAGGDVAMTRADHASGTDRIAQVAADRGWASDAIVVNLQGDEPLVPPALLTGLARDLFSRADVAMATLATPIDDLHEVLSPDVVKVVLDDAGLALYFSRAPIPWPRDAWRANPRAPANLPRLPDGAAYLRHLGLYAYRVSTLARLSAEPASVLEQTESLEQLRCLSLGLSIHVGIAPEAPPPGVDNQADLDRVARIFRQGDARG